MKEIKLSGNDTHLVLMKNRAKVNWEIADLNQRGGVTDIATQKYMAGRCLSQGSVTAEPVFLTTVLCRVLTPSTVLHPLPQAVSLKYTEKSVREERLEWSQ